jgi:hypothetical protein
LLVQRVAGLVRGAEQRCRQVVAVVAGRDAHVLAREGHLERVHRAVEPPALEVVAQTLGQLPTEGALPLFGKVAEQEVAPGRRPGAGLFQDRQDAGPQFGEQTLEADGRLARLVGRDHRVVRVARPSRAVGVLARQRHGFLQMRREDREVAARAGLDPGRLRDGAQGGALLRQRCRHAAVVLHGLAHLGHHRVAQVVGRGLHQGRFGGVERARGVGMQQHVQRHPRQRGNLQPAAGGATGRHHGAESHTSTEAALSTSLIAPMRSSSAAKGVEVAFMVQWWG